jgi:hypothetical protein
MCEMKKYIPPTIFNAREHYIIHQVEEIEICGPVHVDTERGVNQYPVQFKTFFNLYLNHSIISNEQ